MASKKISVLVPDHVYVPKHEIISIKEAEQVLKKFNCKPTELPLIFEKQNYVECKHLNGP